MMNEPPTVLIVEDEPVVREAAARALAEEGWTVESVPDAPEAFSRLDSFRFEVVLCDLMLPGSSGLAVLARCLVACPETPFIMITGYATLNATLRAFRAGVFDLLPKPFDTHELAGVVDRARRFSSLSETQSRGTSSRAQHSGAPPEAFLLGKHSWATVDEEGSATVGLGATFLGTVTGAARIELPFEGENVLQARQLARIACTDGSIHRVWAPLSGRVIAVNENSREILEPSSEGGRPPPWLARIAPSRADAEAPCLTRSDKLTDGKNGMRKEADESWFSRSSC